MYILLKLYYNFKNDFNYLIVKSLANNNNTGFRAELLSLQLIQKQAKTWN